MELSWAILEKLSKENGDSYYLLDVERFSQNFDEFLMSFRKIYPKSYICYSYKTNYIPELCKIVNQKGGYAEVVSEMEYELALKIGVLPEKIIVNSPFKNFDFLEKALLNESIVNFDSYYEIEYLKEIVKKHKNKVFSIGIRCNFAKPYKEKFSRFGFDVNNEEFVYAFKELIDVYGVRIKGIHCHYPYRDLESFIYRIENLLNVANNLFNEPPEYIDIGGGFFGKMPQSLKEQFNCYIPTYEDYAKLIATKMKENYNYLKESLKPKLFLEPGTAIVADTMKYVCKVIDIKKINNKFIAITSGSVINMGHSNKVKRPFKIYSNETATNYYYNIDITGYTCMEDDYLITNYNGPLTKGDYIVIDNLGSYSFNFKPPFILPNVPILKYEPSNKTFVVVKRKENFEHIFDTFVF